MTSVDGLRLFAPLMWENDGTANIPLKAGTANIPLEALQRGPGKRRHAPGGYSELARLAFLCPTFMCALSLSPRAPRLQHSRTIPNLSSLPPLHAALSLIVASGGRRDEQVAVQIGDRAHRP
jgi:hypothetical protein